MRHAFWFVLGPLVGLIVGRLSGWPPAVTLLPVLLFYPAYWSRLQPGGEMRLVGWSLLWAATLSAAVITWTALDPASAGAMIPNGEPYRVEMFHWIRTAEGAEGDPRLFLPIHATHFSLFLIASLLSAGLLGLLMGSFLLGYMSFYVGSVVAASGSPWTVLVGWHPWSILRVVGFVTCGVAVSMVLRHRSLKVVSWRVLALGGSLVVVDAVLKTVLAESWRQMLVQLVE